MAERPRRRAHPQPLQVLRPLGAAQLREIRLQLRAHQREGLDLDREVSDLARQIRDLGREIRDLDREISDLAREIRRGAGGPSLGARARSQRSFRRLQRRLPAEREVGVGVRVGLELGLGLGLGLG